MGCSNLKLHQTFEVKNIFKQENIMLQLTFNPGLTLTGFRTTSNYSKYNYFIKTIASYTLVHTFVHDKYSPVRWVSRNLRPKSKTIRVFTADCFKSSCLLFVDTIGTLRYQDGELRRGRHCKSKTGTSLVVAAKTKILKVAGNSFQYFSRLRV